MDLALNKVKDMNIIASEIIEFEKYCLDFYGEGGINTLGTSEQVVNAVNEYLSSKALSDIEFDSFDREAVGNIIRTKKKLEIWK